MTQTFRSRDEQVDALAYELWDGGVCDAAREISPGIIDEAIALGAAEHHERVTALEARVAELEGAFEEVLMQINCMDLHDWVERPLPGCQVKEQCLSLLSGCLASLKRDGDAP